MTPDAVRLDLCTRQYEEAKAALLAQGWPGAADGQEPWFGFPYLQAQLPEELRLHQIHQPRARRRPGAGSAGV